VQLVVGLGLAAALLASALLKLAAPRSSRAALATFDVPEWARPTVWSTVVVTEVVLAAGVALGVDAAAWAAAALLAFFAVALAAAIRRGRAGAPCACFGARSRVSRSAVARNVVLAGAFAGLPWLPDGRLTTDGWLALGLAASLAGLAALAVLTLALAREVGLLRLQLAPQAALEVPDEGPPVGERSALIERFAGDAPLALAVFTSAGCALCRTLAPSIAAFSRSPHVEVATFDEMDDAAAWDEAAAPGSPFAVALDAEGIVRAKGTFNNLAQLEGILAAAERRVARV
jgi:methylamine utilization protein MauE